MVGELLDQSQVVAHQQDRGPATLQPRDPVQAAVGENLVPDRQDLVHHQHVRLHRDRHREPEPDVHARGVGLDGLVDELADAGELDDLRQTAQDLRPREPEHHAVDDRVVAPGDLGVKPRP